MWLFGGHSKKHTRQSMEANKAPNELCQVVVQPSTTHALRGVVNNVHVMFDVITGTVSNPTLHAYAKQWPTEGGSTGHTVEEQETKRPPINLAIVLDRSGSMDSGHKLSNAKKAIIKVIEALGSEDVLHLVVYGSSVETIFQNSNPAAEREGLIARVKSVKTEGMTNMYAGLDRGAEVVSNYTKSGYTNRIFLFSDGLVNEGVTDKREIYKFIAEVLPLSAQAASPV